MRNLPTLQTDSVTVDGQTVTVERSSGNVFHDLGFKNAEELQLKAALAAQILGAIRERGITQKAAAQMSGLKSPDISNICNARLDGISVERLFLVLNRLGRNIEIRVSAEDREDATTLVLAA